MRSSGSEILITQNLSKFFDGLKALNRVNINVNKGEITLVIGPNGSGKTTLINTISGFYKADEGRVLFKGKDITNKPPHEINRLGIVRTFQIPKPLKKLTVLENLLIATDNPGEKIFGSLKKDWIKVEEEVVQKAFEILEFLKIDHLWDTEFVLLNYVDYVYVMANGQIIAEGLGDEILNNRKVVEVYLGAAHGEAECGV